MITVLLDKALVNIVLFFPILKKMNSKNCFDNNNDIKNNNIYRKLI